MLSNDSTSNATGEQHARSLQHRHLAPDERVPVSQPLAVVAADADRWALAAARASRARIDFHTLDYAPNAWAVDSASRPGHRHHVRLWLSPLRVLCSCEAGSFGRPCMHAALVLGWFDALPAAPAEAETPEADAAGPGWATHITGRRVAGRTQVVLTDGASEQPLAHFARHSTTYEWGYYGAGPSDLARSILAAVAGDDAAELHAYEFKCEVVAGLPYAGWTLAIGDVRAWLAGRSERLVA